MTDIGIGSWPARRARMNPDGAALVSDAESVTYGQLADRVSDLAKLFRDLGISRGDRVAYLGPNDIATFECLFAAGRRGAIFVSLNTRLSAPEISYMLRDSGARVLVHGPECAELVAKAAPGTGVQHVLSVADLREAVRDAAPTPPLEESQVGMDDPALILYTSGTTGRPKGAVLTHGNITWNTVNQLAHIDALSTDIAACVAPLFHVTGLGQVSMPTLLKGGTVVVVPKFDPAGFLALIERRKVTAFSAVPTMLQMLCEHPDWEQADLSSIRYVIYGGSPILERVAKEWLQRGITVQQGYGMTEASPGVFMALAEGGLDRPVSSGVPHFFTDVRVETPDGVRLTGPGEGELMVRGPNIFAGYWERPAESSQAMTDDGWFRTGDVVRVDPDGWAYVVDRVKDMIISGGENIYPAEVEAVIAELDGVSGVAVVAVPDERWGEVGCAYVTVEDGAVLDRDAVLAHLATRLARYKIPRYVEFCPELPRTATGKVQRALLRDRARHDHTPTTTEDS